jgi:two-component sensor histidine kinase
VFKGETCVDIESYETARMNTVYFETSFHPIYDVDKIIRGISIFSKNITERIKTENKIINALKEKEVLLSEIHHRIKNNLAMVSSMLHLQEMNIENNEAKAALALSRKRIKTTALIHELLYKNETFHDIRLNEFLNELFMLLRTNENIDLVLIGEEVSFKLNTALPLGLMLNEIMLNSFKHSYKNALQGKTKISSQIEDNYLIIEYCDCQGNFPNTVDFANSSTTGLTLIHTFAEQLNGSIQLISNEPPKYLIQIPLNEPS